MTPLLRAAIASRERDRLNLVLLTPGRALPGANRDTVGDTSGRGGDMRSAAAREHLAQTRAHRAERVAKLRAEGLTWVAIAARLRLTVRQVRRAGGAP